MKIKVFAAVFGVLVALGAIGVGTILAQSNAPTGVQGLTDVLQTGTKTACQAWEEALAKQLGVTVQKLQEAQKGAAKEMVDQAVKDGKLTAEQATKAKERIDAASAQNCGHFGWFGGKAAPFGMPGFPGPQDHGKRAPAFGLKINGLEAAAKALNMTVADLTAQLRQGKSVAVVAKDKGVALDAVTKAIVDAETAQIDQALKDGKITAEQAAKAKEGLSSRIDQFLNAKHDDDGPDHRGFPRHR